MIKKKVRLFSPSSHFLKMICKSNIARGKNFAILVIHEYLNLILPVNKTLVIGFDMKTSVPVSCA